MADMDVERENGDVWEETGFRVSWGGILAGLVVAMALQIVFSLLGLAIGLSTWEPSEALAGFGVGAGIWAAISAIVALFVGGLTTGRLSGVLETGDGAIHGIVVWGLSLIVGLWLIVNGAGFILGGAFGLISTALQSFAGSVGQIPVIQLGTIQPDSLIPADTMVPEPLAIAEQAGDVAKRVAWWTLLVLGLSAAAAAGGAASTAES